ncbi:MAG: FliG C-terminal domain-containing protein [Elusimicrobiota bacterium]
MPQKKGHRSMLLPGIPGIILFVLIGHSFLPTAVHSQTSAETKISIETSLENRVTKVLKEITGSEKLIVIVNADVYSEKEKKEVKLKTEKQKPKMVLPGVPVKESIGDRKLEDLLAPLDLGDTKTMIKRMTATIMLEKGMSDSIVELVRKVASGLLGISPERGDQLIIEKIEFQRTQFSWSSLLYPPNIFWVIGIGLATMFVFTSVNFLFNPFKIFSRNIVDVISGYVAAQKERAANEDIFGGPGGARSGGQADAALGTPAGSDTMAAAGSSEEKLPFRFVRPENQKDVQEILKYETPENIAIILNYLDRNLSSRLFWSLPADMQTKVSIRFASARQLNPEDVRSLEQKVKDQLDYSLGGEDYIVNLLEYADVAAQNKIITHLQAKNPEFAKGIKAAIFNFEDIAKFDNTTIQSVIRRVNLPVFAQILKTMDDEFKTKIFGAIPEVARRRLQQEMELGRPVSEQLLRDEKRRVVGMIRRLQQEGLIVKESKT